MKNRKIVGVIPARYQSSRLPGKPLSEICGKTMIQRVYENCCRSTLLDRVIVATDDERIAENVRSFGGEVVMTSSTITTGTERCLAALKEVDYDYAVNIQGDEPLIDPVVIDKTVLSLLESEGFVCATPVKVVKDNDELLSSDCVKVVFGKEMRAIYFSRSVIPFNRDERRGEQYYKHIGLYVYQKSFLIDYVRLKQSPLELTESLEQLRILENGYSIKCCIVDYEAIGVDTQEDLEKVRKIISEKL